MTGASVDIDITQGEDWTTDVIWTDQLDDGIPVVHPCRMDIKSFGGQTLISLTTNPDIPEGEIPGIKASTNIGLLQLHIPKASTVNFPPGQYRYDLFVTTDDGDEYAGPQTVPILVGRVNVHKRTTQMESV